MPGLKFTNHFARQLPADFYTKVNPTGFANPSLVGFNNEAAKLIGLKKSNDTVDYFCGNKLFKDADYLASVYSGHQFGHYVPQLGDGRAIMIGEANGYEIQLKGSGKTPYSRFGDGRAVLRSSIREYLCSEAVHNLGIPTTRALCIIGSDENVQRETVEKAAMVARLSPSFLRFGHFEYFYHTDKHQNLRELADFTIANYFPGHSYEEFFASVVEKTASLIAQWQAFGFCHGVMNTDNMSILGLTIDYGPFGFMEEFNPQYICNHSDHSSRYSYEQQPSVGLWNLMALAQALSPLVPHNKAQSALKNYQNILVTEYSNLMLDKLGLPEGNMDLVKQLLELLAQNRVDYSNFMRDLGHSENLRDRFLNRDGFDAWHQLYTSAKIKEPAGNPKYILRNYLAETVIKEAGQGDYSGVDKLLKILIKPYDEQPEFAAYAAEPPEWGKSLKISCSS